VAFDDVINAKLEKIVLKISFHFRFFLHFFSAFFEKKTNSGSNPTQIKKRYKSFPQ